MCYYQIGDDMKIFFDKYKNILKGIFSFILFFSSSYIQSLIVIILNLKKLTIKDAVVVNFLSSLIITLILILIYRKDLIKEFKIYKNNLTKNIDIGIKYWLIGLCFMMISNVIISFLFKAGQANNEQAVQKMITAMPYLLLISAGILAPINEEILFRKVFKDTIKNKIVCILVSGILFGYMHVTSATTLSQFMYIIPYSSLGIAFAIMYSKTDTVFTSISMHMFHNITLTLLSILV